MRTGKPYGDKLPSRAGPETDDGLPGKPVGGEKPTHYLSAFARNSPEGVKGRVGEAWMKPDGSISIRLNPYVTLTSEVGLTLWPRNERDDTRN